MRKKTYCHLTLVPWIVSVSFLSFLLLAACSCTVTPAPAQATTATSINDDVPRVGSLNLDEVVLRLSQTPLTEIGPHLEKSSGKEVRAAPIEGTTTEERLKNARALMKVFAQSIAYTPTDLSLWEKGLGALRFAEEIAFDEKGSPETSIEGVGLLWQFYKGAFEAQRTFDAFHDLRAAVGKKKNGASDQEVREFMQTTWSRAGEMRDAAGAEILRTRQLIDAVPDVLQNLADRARREERRDEALHLAEEAVRVLGEEVSEAGWIWLAGHYYSSLDIRRGDIAMARAGMNFSDPLSADFGIGLRDRLNDVADMKVSAIDFTGFLDARRGEVAISTIEHHPDTPPPAPYSVSPLEQSYETLNLRAAAAELAAMPSQGVLTESDIRRAWLLLRLRHYSEMRELTAQLTRSFPYDARVATLEAWLAISEGTSATQPAAASAALVQLEPRRIMERAAMFSHRDSSYFETAILLELMKQISVGVQGTTENPTMITPFDSTDIERLVREYRTLSSGRAAVIMVLTELFRNAPLLDSAPEAQQIAILKRLTDKSLTLVKDHPEQADAWRIATELACLGADRSTWIELLRSEAPVPAEEKPIVAAQQARALICISAATGDEQLLDEARAKMVDLRSSFPIVGAELACPLADAATLKAALHGAESDWSRAVSAIEGCLRTTLANDERTRYKSNEAFCFSRIGSRPGTEKISREEVFRRGVTDWHIAVNLASVYLADGGIDDAVAVLYAAANDTRTISTTFEEKSEDMEWVRWLFWLFGADGKTTDQLQMAFQLEELRSIPDAIDDPWREHGVHLVRGDRDFSVGWNVSGELFSQIVVRTPLALWFYSSAPVTDVEIEKVFKKSSPPDLAQTPSTISRTVRGPTGKVR